MWVTKLKRNSIKKNWSDIFKILKTSMINSFIIFFESLESDVIVKKLGWYLNKIVGEWRPRFYLIGDQIILLIFFFSKIYMPTSKWIITKPQLHRLTRNEIRSVGKTSKEPLDLRVYDGFWVFALKLKENWINSRTSYYDEDENSLYKIGH